MPVKEIHRLSTAWDNPDAFQPERWTQEKNFKKGCFLPFNIGTHNCIGTLSFPGDVLSYPHPGQRFAMLEMRIVLAMLLRYFEFTPVSTFTPRLSIHFMSPAQSIQVHVKRRARSD